MLMNIQGRDSQFSSKPSQESGCIRWIIFILVWVWVVVVIAGRLGSQILATSAITMFEDAYWLVFPLVEGVLLLIPLVPLVLLVRSTPWISIYRIWLFAALYVLLLAPISIVFPAAFQLQAVLNILLSLLAAALLSYIVRRRLPQAILEGGYVNETSHAQGPDIFTALLPAALFGIPWVLFGALGSPVDTMLGLASGLAFGLAAAVGLLYLMLGFRSTGYSPMRSILFAGFSAGVALMIASSAVGYPFGGMQLLLAVCLPPLGWFAVYLIQRTGPIERPDGYSAKIIIQMLVPAASLLGLAAAFPLIFIDPDELALVISASKGEILVWALAAAGLSAAVAWASALAGVQRVLATARVNAGSMTDKLRPERRSFIPIAAALAWLALLAAYLIGGQPGFYGEKIFVILNDQIDLSDASGINDYTQRRAFVFQTLVDHASRTQAPLQQDLERFGIAYTSYYLVNALEVSGGPLVKAWIARRPEVDRVLDSPIMRPLPSTPPTASGSQSRPDRPQWNLTQISADRVWKELGVTGEGVLIGLSDSGAQYDHPEFSDSYRGSDGDHDYNWYDPWNNTNTPVDIGGHGTHTLGSILGNSTGVAPDARWIACANLARNLGNPARYLDCLQFMLAPFPQNGDPFLDGDPARGADILNNSWGCPEIEGCDPQTLQPAFDALAEAGIFVVASAGNDGPFCGSLNNPPAIYPTVYTVAASDVDDVLAVFSSRGPLQGADWVKPNLTAPGVDVLSSMPEGTYGIMSGTSMAGPHVAGAVALMWSANPGLRGEIQRTREILNNTARTDQGLITSCPGAADTPSTSSGYGLLNAYAAVQASLDISTAR